MTPGKHPQEEERLRELRRYGILDTERERDFDEIVELASELCGKAVSVVNFIDDDRQWFKAEVGLGVRSTPLDTSLCGHVILQDDFVEIPDTLADPRMADNPLCTEEPGFRFYAGAVLKGANGLPLGTLCVLDHTPGTLNDTQRRVMKVLARQVMR
ncbi:MAG: GAF domain-containing protein, partial [Qipengyuania sp.]